MSQGTHETEIKLAVKDARSARRLLREAGFVVSRPRVLTFWHGVDEGFRGRKPIDQDFLDHHQGDRPQ